MTLAGIKIFLVWLKKKDIVDVPNERSSHETPTPVGGGVVILLVTLSLFFLYLFINEQEIPWSFFAGSLLIGLVSWFDDLYAISIFKRFLVHSFAAILVMVNLGVVHRIHIPVYGLIEVGNFVYVLWFLWIVWFINAYNFMDGIDGLAGIQSAIAGLAWAFLANLQGSPDIEILGLIIAASSVGFLFFNWQPAKIFMGDVGSAFLGFTFAVFPLLASKKSESYGGNLIFVSVLFVWIFAFDTALTFLIRLSKREAVWKAHRSHIYQKLIIKGWTHAKTAAVYGILAAMISGLTILRFIKTDIGDLYLLLFVGAVSAGLLILTYNFKSVSV